MESKIREYVEKKFAIYPNTGKMSAFRQELLSVMLRKYHDCREKGMSEQKSYTMAMNVMSHYSEEKSLYYVNGGGKKKAAIIFSHIFEGIA